MSDTATEITKRDTPPADDVAAVMGIIAKAAADSSVDVVKLEKLMDLQERILNRNAKAAFSADYVEMKPHLPKVIRSKHNTQTKSMYAPLEDINLSVDPILQRFGFGTSTKIVSQTDNSVTVKAELWHRAGHVEETTITMPLDKTGIAGTVNKTLPHATSSSVTYAKRVAICALLNISTGDDNDGQITAGTITTEQAADLDTRARAVGDTYLSKFLEWLGVKTALEITVKDYKRADEALKDAEKKKAAKAQKATGSNE